ncbi:GGDEF domain-containing protein [Rheinheimera nanhaiensis]|uniref:diguanylate cyclase n=1 Tax=Rheinheimera nanhaiensis E407-8 TaxID=562729 RepID=I1E2Z4_9GAMM|nr:diguanylate cyclase [Rheinheimera nanhaiensis]GAB60672.1 two-component system, chemotaxis family, response regulator WspR [Rheinheimera nanhaiensis E407-8]
MADTVNALPHFWPVLQALPTPVLYKEHSRSRILANAAALALFNSESNSSPGDSSLSLADIQQLPLYNADNAKRYDLLHNPLLMALSGSEMQLSLLVGDSAAPDSRRCYQLHSKLVALSFTLHSSVLISLLPAAGHAQVISGQLPATDIAELEEALAFDKLISLISTELINVQDQQLDQHIHDALAAVGEFCHSDRSYVFQFTPDYTEMSNTHEWVRQGISSHQAQLQHIPKAALPYFFSKMAQDYVFAVSDVSKLPAEAAAEQQEFVAEDIQSVLCCAMRSDEELLGFVGCDMVSRRRDWTSTDLRRMKLVGDMLAKTLQNVRYRQSLQQMQQQLLAANNELTQLANQDGLTGIANRRQFDHCLNNELKRCSRNGLPLGLILLDIDRFKSYNDHYGHQAGDAALKQLATVLQQQVKRQGELAARYGGEEFAIILPGSNLSACQQVANNIRQQLAQLNISHQHSDIKSYLTVSLGYCSSIPSIQDDGLQLLKRVDAALYQAKKSGRDQACPAQ